MTDLQVKYQALEEDKRYHDAMISKMEKEKEKMDKEMGLIGAQQQVAASQVSKNMFETQQVIKEMEMLQEQIDFYAANQYASWIQGGLSSTGNFLKGVGGFFG